MQIAFRIRRLFLRLFRVRTRGVKVMVFNRAGELLLIRNSYGPSHLFLLPGGGIGRRESPDAAARREVKEEVGLDLHELTQVSVHSSHAEGKRDTIALFTAVADGAPRPDSLEVEEARFFALDSLPENISDATLRRILERRGERACDGRW